MCRLAKEGFRLARILQLMPASLPQPPPRRRLNVGIHIRTRSRTLHGLARASGGSNRKPRHQVVSFLLTAVLFNSDLIFLKSPRNRDRLRYPHRGGSELRSMKGPLPETGRPLHLRKSNPPSLSQPSSTRDLPCSARALVPDVLLPLPREACYETPY